MALRVIKNNWCLWEMQDAETSANGALSIDANGVLSIDSQANSRDLLARPLHVQGGDTIELECDAYAESGTLYLIAGCGTFTQGVNDAAGNRAKTEINVPVGSWRHFHAEFVVPAHFGVVNGFVAVGCSNPNSGVGKVKNPVVRVNGAEVGAMPKSGGCASICGTSRNYNLFLQSHDLTVADGYVAVNGTNDNIFMAPVGNYRVGTAFHGSDYISSAVAIVHHEADAATGGHLRLATTGSTVIGEHEATEDGTTLGQISVFGDSGEDWAKAASITFVQIEPADSTKDYVQTNMKFQNGTAEGIKTQLIIWGDTANGGVTPGSSGLQMLGSPGHKWSEVHAATGAINTSDAREKDNLEKPSDALMRAWGKVSFKVFQMRDAIAKKGAEAARLHVGVIAQEVQEAFASEGLDASHYGLFCYDEWDDRYETELIVDAEEHVDLKTGETVPARTHIERRLVTPAGSSYGIRYDEALALECAYQRWRLEQIEARLNGSAE